jgi:hypothetical protein
VIQEAATGVGLTIKLMPSGAGHDAQDVARIAPDRNDLCSKHRWDQPLAQRIHDRFRYGEWCQCFAAVDIESG